MLKRIKKEDLIICLECNGVYIDTGPEDALSIIRHKCPSCRGSKLRWAIDV